MTPFNQSKFVLQCKIRQKNNHMKTLQQTCAGMSGSFTGRHQSRSPPCSQGESSPEARRYVYLDLMQVWKSNKHVAAAVTHATFISPQQPVRSNRLEKRRNTGKEKPQLSVSPHVCLHYI